MITLAEHADILKLRDIIEEQGEIISTLRQELNLVKAIQKDHVNQLQYLHNGVKNLEQYKTDKTITPIINPPWNIVYGQGQH
jgi:predicted RNA-binding protein with EMAP domain